MKKNILGLDLCTLRAWGITLACAYCFLRNSPKEICADWLKIVFLQLDGNTELAQAVDVMMVSANKFTFFCIIKEKKLFPFLLRNTHIVLCSHSISPSPKLPLVLLSVKSIRI